MAVFSINGYDSYSGCDIVVTASLPLGENNETTYFTLGSLQTLSVSTHQDKRPVRSIGNINAKDYVMGQRTIAGSLVFAVFDRHFADKIMKSVSVIMPDEIPALNLTVNFANEYGRSSRMAIYGVKLINEGQVMSINDLYTENTYQFVALGMEVLTADNDKDSTESGGGGGKQPDTVGKAPGSNKTPAQDEIINKDDIVGEVINSEEFQASGGRVISDQLRNNSDYSNKETISLFASVEQPALNETTGLVTLTLSPIQREGFIYISNLISGETVHTIQVNNSKNYTTELTVGYYNAIYMNTMRTKESNVVKIVVRKTDAEITASTANAAMARNSFPIIENLKSDSISVSVYNNNFNNVVCFSSGEEEYIQTNNNKTIVFNDLRSNTEYNIYATNGTNESNIVTIKTFPEKNTYYNMFKEFIRSNRNMLQNDYDTMINKLDSLLVKNDEGKMQWDYGNILDGVSTLDNDIVKQELLLYCIQFENSMLEAYNINNPYKLNIIRNDIFDTNLTTKDWDLTKYYSIKDGKSKLEGLMTSDDMFNGQPNKIYSLQGISDNIGSIKQYLTVFSAEGKEFLNKYKDVNKYKTLDLASIRATYPSLNSEELYALAIKDNHLCDRYILEEPYIYKEDNVIYADIDYSDKVLLDDVYYLCISEIYSTLDTIPCRKIPFNRLTKEINLDENYIPFDSEHIYNAWIENTTGNILSKTFIFNYKQSAGLSKALDKDLLKLLESKKRLLLNRLPNANKILTDIIHDLYSSNVPLKNLDTMLELEILKYGINSYYISDPLSDMLYSAVLVNINNKLNINRSNVFKMYKDTNQFYISPVTNLDVKIITKSFDVDMEEVTCMVHNTETVINMAGDYMAIYLINAHVDKILGVLVLDCSNYEYKALGFNVEVGEING